MIRAIFLAMMMALTGLAAAAEKAGVGAWENPSNRTLEWIERGPEISWYYNWRTTQMWYERQVPRSVEFVPMISRREDVGKAIKSDLPVRTLLGFNEPDAKENGRQKLSVAEAIALWPRLEAHGLRLGSPATLRSGTLGRGSWQRRFMDEVERRGLRVDFMAVHYYSKDGDVDAFRRWLIAVHREYRRPIWVTEMAHIDWMRPRTASYQANARFITEAIRMMEELPFVERHAWFAATPYRYKGTTPKINLLRNNLRPTPVGVAFERVLADLATRRVAGLSETSER